MTVNIKTLIPLVSRTFSTQNTLLGSINPDTNHNLRVMSTPEWPVPYYQRAFRHPPSLERRIGNISSFMLPLHDYNVLVAKEILKSIGKGYVVEAVENHFNIKTYKT